MTAHITADVILRKGFLYPIGHLLALGACSNFPCVDRE
jgi:predicted Zn-dependent protease